MISRIYMHNNMYKKQLDTLMCQAVFYVSEAQSANLLTASGMGWVSFAVLSLASRMR